jgi:hypothetical protein
LGREPENGTTLARDQSLLKRQSASLEFHRLDTSLNNLVNQSISQLSAKEKEPADWLTGDL